MSPGVVLVDVTVVVILCAIMTLLVVLTVVVCPCHQKTALVVWNLMGLLHNHLALLVVVTVVCRDIYVSPTVSVLVPLCHQLTDGMSVSSADCSGCFRCIGTSASSYLALLLL
jgi:hypothetical protein